MKTILRVFVAIFVFTSFSFADIINVPGDVNSIQEGINSAENGDTVLVYIGIYNENINFNGKNIVVGSLFITTRDTSYISKTVIDGNNSGRVVTFEKSEDSRAILSGFRITNGDGGIFIHNSNPTMTHLLINYNTAGPPGGGILCDNSSFSLSNSTIANNSGNDGGGIGARNSYFNLSYVKIINNSAHSDDGGGIGCESCDFNLSNVKIANNTAADKGGGIELLNGGKVSLSKITISDNSARGGGGIWFDGDSCNLSNVIIHDNYAKDDGGGVYFTENVASFIFDKDNRCSIYWNQASQLGNDLYSANDNIISVVVDTFTVLNPTSYYAYPINSFTFDIQNAKIEKTNRLINVPGDVPTIQAGINNAVDGDTVLVAPGTYYENIDFKGKNIVVGSLCLTTGDTSFISNTVIDGSQPTNPDNGSVVYFISGEKSLAELNGFTITGGSGTWFWAWGNTSQTHGGGILCRNSSPHLLNLVVKGNVAESSNGAGICCLDNSNPLIENVIVTENDGRGNASTNDASAGILCAGSSPILKRVKIFNNTGLMSGGMYCNEGSNPVLINVTISGNRIFGSDWFDDLAEFCVWQGSNPILVNTIIWNDEINEILIRDPESSVTITHSDIQGGSDGIISNDEENVQWLDGNMSEDPRFCDAANGDFSLLEGSCCIDAGIQDTFLLLNNSIYGIYIPPMSYVDDAPDIGASEYDPATIVNFPVSSPLEFALYQNYPNPFNPLTKIEFAIREPGQVKIEVYNTLGQWIVTLLDKQINRGQHQIEFNGSDLSSGMYFYRIEAGEFQDVKKMILLR
jgi:hypothetical protein